MKSPSGIKPLSHNTTEWSLRKPLNPVIPEQLNEVTLLSDSKFEVQPEPVVDQEDNINIIVHTGPEAE